jgi:hypothetical protein
VYLLFAENEKKFLSLSFINSYFAQKKKVKNNLEFTELSLHYLLLYIAYEFLQ